MEMELNKIKEFILKHKFLSALLVLDLISFIISFIIGIFISTIGILFFFLIFITATYILVLFEKYNTKIFISSLVLFIITLLNNLQLFAIIYFILLIFVLPESFMLLILKHFALFEKQNIIVKTIIIDAIILITFFMLFGFATLLLEMQKI